jgi:acyl dehydratase
MKIGDEATATMVVSDEFVRQFAVLTGDMNPLHLDDAYARSTRFGKRIAHGMIAASLIASVLGDTLPGPGSVYLGQTLRFIKPVHIGDKLWATVRVMEIECCNTITLSTFCLNQDGALVVNGEATVWCPKE